MRRSVLPLLLMASVSAHAQAPQATRFSGSGGLQPAADTSADGRFALRADLRPAAAAKSDGRFTLAARMRPTDAAAATACSAAGPALFANGFEN